MTGNYRHTGPFAFEANEPTDPDEIVVPDDLTDLSAEELDEEHEGSLAQRLVDTFLAINDDDESRSDPDKVREMADIAEGIERVRAERERRATQRQEAQAEADALRERVLGGPVASDEEPEGEAEPEAEPEATVKPAAKPEVVETAEAPDVAIAASARQTEPAKVAKTLRINVPMSEIRARAPKPEVPPALKITAAADVPRVQAGKQFDDITELSYAFHERAKSTPISASGNVGGPKVASVRQDFDHVLNVDSTPSDVERVFKEITNPSALVAGGGWCAPSEVTYDFFDITCEDGMLDLPTVGIERGGLRWPTSPSMADVFTGTFTNASNPWLWSETDDILTVTGTVNKPCVRVPCPTFNDARLECYGICLTAGNLTDAAYPEATRHQVGLLRSAHYHAMNQRYVASIAALATPVATGGINCPAESITIDLLTATDWAATDYRTRVGMCEDSVLEVVLPIWARAAMRSDLARRRGDRSFLEITNAELDNFFDVRNVRVQYVNDWQVRGTNQPGGTNPTTAFPTTVQFIIYAAGTFVRGNGLVLDLGVIRDSTLNAENDHTALWTEECHLIAQRGHLARSYTVCVCVSGRVGIDDLTCA